MCTPDLVILNFKYLCVFKSLKLFPVVMQMFDQVFLYYTQMSIAVHMCF